MANKKLHNIIHKVVSESLRLYENKMQSMSYKDEIENVSRKIFMDLHLAKNNPKYNKPFVMKSFPTVFIILCGEIWYKRYYGEGNGIHTSDGTIGFYSPDDGEIYLNASHLYNISDIFSTVAHELEHHIDYQRSFEIHDNGGNDGNYMFRQTLDGEFDGDTAERIRNIQYYLWDGTEFNAHADKVLSNNFNRVERTYKRLNRDLDIIRSRKVDESNIEMWMSLSGLVSNSKNSSFEMPNGRTKFRGDNLEYYDKRYNKNPDKYQDMESRKELLDRSKHYEAAYIRRAFISQSYKRLKHWREVMWKKYMYYQMEFGRKNQFLN